MRMEGKDIEQKIVEEMGLCGGVKQGDVQQEVIFSMSVSHKDC